MRGLPKGAMTTPMGVGNGVGVGVGKLGVDEEALLPPPGPHARRIADEAKRSSNGITRLSGWVIVESARVWGGSHNPQTSARCSELR